MQNGITPKANGSADLLRFSAINFGQKRFVFVATLGHGRREYAEICFGLRQRDWILGIEHAFSYFVRPEKVGSDLTRRLQ